MASAEKKINDDGAIEGGLPAIDAALRAPHNLAKQGGDDVAFRIRTKAKFKQAGLI
jgi:hypothetical protein